MASNLPNAKIWKTADEIHQIVSGLADKLNNKYAEMMDEEIIVIGVLNGCYMFMSDLTKLLRFKFRADFIAVSSYTDNLQTENIEIRGKLKYGVKNCRLIVVDDILDSGQTLKNVDSYLTSLEPKSIDYVTLILSNNVVYKEMLGKTIYGLIKPDIYIYGYGMDNKEEYRGLPDIWYV